MPLLTGVSLPQAWAAASTPFGQSLRGCFRWQLEETHLPQQRIRLLAQGASGGSRLGHQGFILSRGFVHLPHGVPDFADAG